jgi:sulfopyruvate decarboxylase TPP-binding subunit
MIFSGSEIVDQLAQMNVSHVVWVPDSELGRWEADLEAAAGCQLVRVCREGEAWPLAAGLLLGGRSPLVVMQSTGLFESGDALRNVVHDLQLPVFALVGARSWLTPHANDSARRFVEPVLRTWEIDFVTIESCHEQHRLAEHYRHCRESQKAGIALLAE